MVETVKVLKIEDDNLKESTHREKILRQSAELAGKRVILLCTDGDTLEGSIVNPLQDPRRRSFGGAVDFIPDDPNEGVTCTIHIPPANIEDIIGA